MGTPATAIAGNTQRHTRTQTHTHTYKRHSPWSGAGVVSSADTGDAQGDSDGLGSHTAGHTPAQSKGTGAHGDGAAHRYGWHRAADADRREAGLNFNSNSSRSSACTRTNVTGRE